MKLFFTVGFIQQISNCLKASDFSPEYEYVGLKSDSVCNSKTCPINGTVCPDFSGAKDKNNNFSQPVSKGGDTPWQDGGFKSVHFNLPASNRLYRVPLLHLVFPQNISLFV